MKIDTCHRDESECDRPDNATEALMLTGQSAYKSQGRIHLPAFCIEMSEVTVRQSGDMCVQIDLLAQSPIGNELALFIRLTPFGARAIADQLLASALIVDGKVASDASAAIEKARKS